MRFRPFALAAVALAAAFLLDDWAYTDVVYKTVYDADWGRLLRIVGFLPTWFVAAFALWLVERDRIPAAHRRALLLAASPAVAGIVGELLKLSFRRERPEPHNGEYFFRAFSERTWSTGGLAFPSSHVVVAFGAAAMLAYLFPRARWVWFGLAAGCALTRVLAHAHFLSDVVAGALAGIATTALLWRRYGHALLLT